jgi:hypothetical protein
MNQNLVHFPDSENTQREPAWLESLDQVVVEVSRSVLEELGQTSPAAPKFLALHLNFIAVFQLCKITNYNRLNARERWPIVVGIFSRLGPLPQQYTNDSELHDFSFNNLARTS